MARSRDLTQEAMLQELESAAAKLSVKVSYEALAASVGSGGLCRVHGEYRVIIDKRTQTGERLAALAQALGRLPALSALGSAPPADFAELELSQPVRDLLRHYAMRRAS
jgi:hypothetical protein